ncbi:mechanosensitive ion channel family protein [Vibrio sp. SS-MA-C1-2]|uniref:mechanosensitive ion channel family protein n=1 Tax=Vibrio sp. SS-MA-C1-2 TaxID=2908646 RepID=UPI001F39123A|nr:mechanosensitive ion channel family protein [Vibrio sp. SS-MA-C1-2]UJF17697.1 mechanosensitive ion channel family protein [Vibrio sp. SS-MA-C1-2]
MRWSLLLIFTLYQLSFATYTSAEDIVKEENQVEKKISAPVQKIDPRIEELDKLSNEVKALYTEDRGVKGQEKDAIRLQVVKKNDERRKVLASIVDDPKEVRPAVIIKNIELQQEFVSKAKRLLSQYMKEQKATYEKLPTEDKLLKIKIQIEMRQYYAQILSDSWQNYIWLETLGVDVEVQKEELQNEVIQQLEFISAVLQYDKSQEKQYADQLKTATGKEKEKLDLIHLLFERRLNGETTILKSYVGIADNLDIDTTSYKQQLFESTGDLTEDILEVSVLLSILGTWANESKDWLLNNSIQLSFKFLVFFGIIFLGKVISGIVRRIVAKGVSSEKLNLSQLMQSFFVSISGKAIFLLGILIALSQVGLNLAPVLTGFGIAGVIIGFALQDTLSNFASGMMLLIYRPFDVGDSIEAGGVMGKVSSMSLVNTTIRTFDNQIIILPNNKIWGDTIKNVTHERVRRVDMTFGVSYSDDIEKVELMLIKMITDHEKVLKSPDPVVKLHILNASSVDFIVRPWVKTADYWDVYWDITKQVKLEFDKEGISIPFPQQDVHLYMNQQAVAQQQISPNRPATP